MLKTGLVSVTFRKLTPQEIVNLVKQAGLDGIEWGGDIHVPHGDIERAREVRKITEDKGLVTYSYGSYYKVGYENPFSFESVLATAKELNTKTIRVWAGIKNSAQSTIEEWNNVIIDSKRIADLAKLDDIEIAFEYHDNTLADTNASAIKLIEAINSTNVKLFWQPPVGMTIEERITGLKNISKYLSHIHVFYWKEYDRLPLQIGENEWQLYLENLPSDNRERYLSLEFVQNDDVNQFLSDTKVLKRLIK